LKKRLVEAGQAHAALVMVGDEAIAWAEYGTPDELLFVYNGTRTMYEQAGFEFIRSKGMKNTVMRRTVRPVGRGHAAVSAHCPDGA
jgi:hypothetical protein